MIEVLLQIFKAANKIYHLQSLIVKKKIVLWDHVTIQVSGFLIAIILRIGQMLEHKGFEVAFHMSVSVF